MINSHFTPSCLCFMNKYVKTIALVQAKLLIDSVMSVTRSICSGHLQVAGRDITDSVVATVSIFWLIFTSLDWSLDLQMLR